MKKLMFLIGFAIVLMFLLNNVKSVVNILGYLLGIVSPLVLGFAIAFVLNVPLRFLESRLFKSRNKLVHKIKRPASIALSLIIIVSIIAAVLLLVIPEVVKTVQVLFDIVPDFMEKIRVRATDFYNRYPEIKNTVDSIYENRDEISNTVINVAKNSVGGLLGTTFGFITSLFGGVVDFIVGFIFAIYILSNKERLKAQIIKLFKAWFPDRQTSKVFHVFSVADGIFRKFVVGQVTEAVILGTLCTVGMLIFRFPYAGMVGALVGVTALIPIVGGFIGAGVGAFMIMMEDPIKAVLFIVFIIVLQQIEGNLIYPKVVGSSVGLPPMWVLAAVTVGGGLMGILGMLLGVPVASTIYALVREDVNSRFDHREKRRQKIKELLAQADIPQEPKEEPEVKVKNHSENISDN